MQVIVEPTDDILHRFANQIGALGERQAHAAFARAINRTVDTVKTHVVRALVRQTSAPRRIVVSQLRTVKAWPAGGGLEGAIKATGSELSLKEFNPRQFSWGVRAKVWGEMRRYDSHFIYAGHWRSGNPVAGGHVFQRTNGSASLPIELVRGPSIPVEMVKGHTAQVFQEMAPNVLAKRVSHELGRLLPG